MEVNALIEMLTDGLDADQKAVVTAAIQRDAVKTRVAGIKAQKEFDDIIAERQRLQAELEGDKAAGKLGAREYQAWYEKNSKAILENDKAIKDFEAKHGEGSFLKAVNGELPGVAAPPVAAPATGAILTKSDVETLLAEKLKSNGVALSKDDMARLVNEQFQSQFAPTIAGVLKTTGKLVQRHMLAGRKSEIDFDAIDKIMGEKKIDIEQAYAEWDKPEREKLEAAAREAEISRRVEEEIQKRGAKTEFPAGADASQGGGLFNRAESKDFSPNDFKRSLAAEWNKAGSVQ